MFDFTERSAWPCGGGVDQGVWGGGAQVEGGTGNHGMWGGCGPWGVDHGARCGCGPVTGVDKEMVG